MTEMRLPPRAPASGSRASLIDFTHANAGVGDGVHKLKYDGYRLQTVRLYIMNAAEWPRAPTFEPSGR
jgi:hypothetical protein